MKKDLSFATVWWGFGFAVLALVFVLSLVRIPPLPFEAPNNFDKWEHLVVYFLLSSYFAQLLSGRKALVYSAIALISMGGLLEGLQSLTSYRSLDFYDFCANSLGVLLGSLLGLSKLANLISIFDGWLSRFKPERN